MLPSPTKLTVDFFSLAKRVKQANRNNELILKAVGHKPNKSLEILDATAGLGTDAFLLAALGNHVLMLERSPVMGALLQDGLRNYQNQCPITLDLLLVSAHDYLADINTKFFDVVYLDPMYPPRKKSALGKQHMRIIHQIVGPDHDADELLKLALAKAKKRVVVKRPKLAPCLNLTKPDIVFTSGGSLRYDVYIVK